ncbi:MAG: MFS transporter [Holosporales bacterium]
MVVRRVFSFFSALRAVPGGIWAIGFITMMINISTIIVFSLSPSYLTQVVGVSMRGIGQLEGVVEATSWLTRIFSGVMIDAFHKRRPVLMGAYALTAFARVMFVLAPNFGMIFAARFLDRMSNGIQATPREAMVGDLAPKNLKGISFGLRQSMTMMGSLIGALIIQWGFKTWGMDYKTLFWIATIPPIAAVIVLPMLVKETAAPRLQKAPRLSLKQTLNLVTKLSSDFWRVSLVAFVYMLSNFSGAFLILHATRHGLCDGAESQAMIVQNLATMVSALPVGWLADRFDRRYIIGFGFIIAMAANAFLALAEHSNHVLMGAGFWGLQVGIIQSLLLTKVADTTTQEIRGTGFGVYYLLVGIAVFIANKITGHLFEESPTIAFTVSGCFAGLAILGLPFIKAAGETKTS